MPRECRARRVGVAVDLVERCSRPWSSKRGSLRRVCRAAEIHARTAGNPFFAEEMARVLIASGQLEGTPGQYRLRLPAARLEVPDTVQAVLAALLMPFTTR